VFDGLKDGIWGRFNINGEVKQEEIYNLGRLINVSEFKLLDGKIITNSTFIDGEGELIDYYDNGNIFSKSNYLDGRLDGIFVEFHSNGKISQRGRYRNDERVGSWFQYNRRGTLIKEKSYD
jgi:antitoxin component YwqK of YwqJK toxin-antitoxin module